MSMLGADEELQGAIRRRLAGGTRGGPAGARRDRPASPAKALASLSEERRRLLQLFYAGNISGEGFKEAEDRLCTDIEIARTQASVQASEKATQNDLERRFEQVVRILSDLDIGTVWGAAEDAERRILVEEFLEWVTVFPDHLEVTVTGAPALNVLLSEVGLKGSEIIGVGGPT
jgi:hypothetical protein